MTPIKDPAESVVIEFDFKGEMSSISTATVSASIHGYGIDTNVASMLDGSPQVLAPSKVLQRVRNGVAGVNYKLRCVASSGNDVIVRAGVMPVRDA